MQALRFHAAKDLSLAEAVRRAGARRFRPIILTSVTTFVGLLPLLTERSLQAQFLIPMAVSLGAGILFATGITLYLVPCALLMGDDIEKRLRGAWAWYRRPFGGERCRCGPSAPTRSATDEGVPPLDDGG